MRIFYGMLDQAGVNSNIILNFNPNIETLSRKYFLFELGLELIKPHLKNRLDIPTVHITTRELIRLILKTSLQRENRPIRFEDQKRHFCSFCPPQSKKRTTYCCSFVKEQHAMNIVYTSVLNVDHHKILKIFAQLL